jgi:hypothetical protein
MLDWVSYSLIQSHEHELTVQRRFMESRQYRSVVEIMPINIIMKARCITHIFPNLRLVHHSNRL